MFTRPVRLFGAAVIATAVTAGATLAPSSTSATPPAPPAPANPDAPLGYRPFNYLRLWYAANQPGTDRDYTEAEAIAIAQRFDLILATPKGFPPYVAAMKQANPRLKIVLYVKGAYASEPDLPADWYAKGATGERLTNKMWDTYVMNPRSEGWAGEVINDCSRATTLGYDGCLLDSMGTGPFIAGLAPTPIDPATGKKWQMKTWMEDTTKLSAKVKAAFQAPFLVLINGLWQGDRYFDKSGPTKDLALVTDGGQAEGWIRTAGNPINAFRTEASWKKDVDMLGDVGASDRAALAQTKVWVPATDADYERWLRFSVASFLLGTDGTALLTFNEGGRGVFPPVDDPALNFRTGRPLNSYYKDASGLWRRDYNRVTVLVNTSKTPLTITFDKAVRTLDNEVTTTVTLAPSTGQVVKVQDRDIYPAPAAPPAG